MEVLSLVSADALEQCPAPLPGMAAGLRSARRECSPFFLHTAPHQPGKEAAGPAWLQPLLSPPLSLPSLPHCSPPRPSPQLFPVCNSSQLCAHALCDHIFLQQYLCILMLKQYFCPLHGSAWSLCRGRLCLLFHLILTRPLSGRPRRYY